MFVVIVSACMSHEISSYYFCMFIEKTSKQELEMKLMDMEGSLEVFSVTNAALEQKLSSLEEECQERCRMANEWYEKLKVSLLL